jgi:hypothetical protein
MKLHIAGVVVAFLSLALSLVPRTVAQTSTQTASALPRLVRFGGTVKDLNGKPLTGVVGITFALYYEQTGGAALWLETQNVTADSNGHYAALLGSTKPDGLPSELFTSEQAHWVGVQVSGQAEQPRVLLVSAPYALKAGDAETIGGLPPSAFMLAAPLAIGSTANGTAETATPLTAADVTTTGGTADYLPIFSGADTIINSVLYQTGNGATAKVGINTTTPTSTLDVNGTATIRGTLSLPTNGTATATAGKDSQGLNLVASSFSSSTGTAVNQTFQWQAEPANNDTANPSGTLNLLFGLGATPPSQTGLSIASSGAITFVAAQTFPGTGTGDGTVTSVASGTGLTGGPITSSGTLSIAAGGVTNAMLKDSSLTVKAGTDLTGGGSVALGGTATLNLDTTKVPQLAAANTFTGRQTINNTVTITGTNSSGVLQVTNTVTSGTAPAVVATTDSTDSSGVKGVASATSGTSNGVYGFSASSTGFGVKGTSPNVGVYGQSDGGSTTGAKYGYTAGVWGDTGGPSNSLYSGVTGTADENIAGYFENNSSGSETIFAANNAKSSGSAAVLYTIGGHFGGSCTIDVSGNLSCNGSKSAVVPVDGGSRNVALYAIEGPENWFEDAGSAQLSNGAAVVNLEPVFGQTVNTEMEYHVFLTPKADCEGLYVSNETPSGFEVHELRGGRSSIAFDYRIMAKRKDYESVRLADKTSQFGKEAMERIRMRRPVRPSAAPQAGPAAHMPQLKAASHPLAAQSK